MDGNRWPDEPSSFQKMKRKGIDTMFIITKLEIMKGITGTDYSEMKWHEYSETNAYKILDWFFGGSNDSFENITNHLKMANAIIKNGKNTFYSADLPFDLAGRYINGMDMNRVVRPTGNTHKVFVPFGSGGYGKMLDVNEWELTMDIDEFTQLIESVKHYLVDTIMNID